jgi:hypothetical protein
MEMIWHFANMQRNSHRNLNQPPAWMARPAPVPAGARRTVTILRDHFRAGRAHIA